MERNDYWWLLFDAVTLFSWCLYVVRRTPHHMLQAKLIIYSGENIIIALLVSALSSRGHHATPLVYQTRRGSKRYMRNKSNAITTHRRQAQSCVCRWKCGNIFSNVLFM